MDIKLKIDGKVVDLADNSNITLQKNSNVLGSVDKIQTSRSFTIVLPFSLNNKNIFGHLELPSISNSFLTEYKTAILEVEGVFIFNGKAVLLSIGKDGYEIVLTFGELSGLISLISDKKTIAELGLTEIFTDWKNTAPDLTTKQNYGIYAYYTSNDGLIPSQRQKTPVINIGFLLQQIAAYYGLSITSSLDLSNDYLLLTKINNAKNDNTNAIVIQKSAFGYTNSNNLSPNILPVLFSYPLVSQWVIQVNSIDNIETLNFHCAIDSGVGTLVKSDNTGVIEEIGSFTSNGDFSVAANTIVPGEFFHIMAETGNPNWILSCTVGLLADKSFPLTGKLYYKWGEQFTDMDYPLFANCDFTALELLKHIQITNGLFAKQGEVSNAFVFDSFDVLNSKENAQDFSKQFISIEKSEFTFENWAKKNIFKYGKNAEYLTDDYNKGEFDLAYYGLSDENNISTPFATAENTIPLGIRQYGYDGETITDNNLDVIYCKLNEAIQLVAVPFDEILSTKYAVLINKLQNMRICTINLKFTQLQYKNFKENQPIYIKQTGKYFYPITGDFNPNTGIFQLKSFMI